MQLMRLTFGLLAGSGGVAVFSRPQADLQYLALVAQTALAVAPKSVLLLLAPLTDSRTSFLLAGNPGDMVPLWHLCMCFSSLLVMR